MTKGAIGETLQKGQQTNERQAATKRCTDKTDIYRFNISIEKDSEILLRYRNILIFRRETEKSVSFMPNV